jgi:hypothetical protein
VVIDPADANQVGFNPLIGPAESAERRADELVGLFHEMFGSAIGPRSSDVLFHSLLTAARMPDGTLADVPALLSNADFRRRALAKVSDPLTLGPWWAWFDSTSDGEKQQIVMPVQNKLRAFLSRQAIRRMLGQAEPKSSFDEMFTGQPRVVLINLNRGVVGPMASKTLGALILHSAWLAMQRRAAMLQGKRFPVAWVIDEWQDYVGALDFGEVLAQIRGLGGFVIAANQHLGQLSPALRMAVTANARSRIAFRPSSDDARPLAAVFGEPVTSEDLLHLGAFEACTRLYLNNTMTAPFIVKTSPLPTAVNDVKTLRRVSRNRYAVDGVELDEMLRRRWHGEDRLPDGPVGWQRRSGA